MRKSFSMFIIAAFLVFAGASFAGAHSDLPAPGILPTSPFYFLKTWSERVTLFFTFAEGQKAERLSKFAERRLSEAEAIADENPALAGAAAGRYAATIAEAAKALPVSGEDKEALVSFKERSLRHQEVLAELEGSVPEEARDAIINAEENSSKHVFGLVERAEGKEAAAEYMARAEEARQVARAVRLERAKQLPMESGKDGGAPKELRPLGGEQELKELKPLLPIKETGEEGEKGVEPAPMEGPAPMAPPIPQR